jgi:hypothetical protein
MHLALDGAVILNGLQSFARIAPAAPVDMELLKRVAPWILAGVLMAC